MLAPLQCSCSYFTAFFCRSSIFDTLASFGPMWTDKQPFAGQLLSSLLADADRSASRDSLELLSLEEQYSLLAYVGCSSAIIQACGPSCSTDLPGAQLLRNVYLWLHARVSAVSLIPWLSLMHCLFR